MIKWYRTPYFVGWTCRWRRRRLFFFTWDTLKSNAKVKCDIAIKKKLLLVAWLKAGFINLYPFIHLFLKSYIHSISNLFMDLPKSFTVYVSWCQVIGPMQSIFSTCIVKVLFYTKIYSLLNQNHDVYENYYRFSSMTSVEMVLGESD